MEPEIVGNKLIMDGFIYYRSTKNAKKTYWECKRYCENKSCTARAITATLVSTERTPVTQFTAFEHPTPKAHSHPPNQHECQAEEDKNELKRAAEDNPERPPSAILREKNAQIFSTHCLLFKYFGKDGLFLQTFRKNRFQEIWIQKNFRTF